MSNGNQLDPEGIRHAVSMQQAADLAEYNADVQTSLETFKAGNLAGREALKAVALVNSGGAVALLAFIGHLASIGAPSEIMIAFRSSLTWFIQGVTAAVVATGIVYFSRLCDGTSIARRMEARDARRENDATTAAQKDRGERSWWRAWFALNLCTIGTGIYSLISFIVGAVNGYHAFEALAMHGRS